jgi:hypothetical protein
MRAFEFFAIVYYAVATIKMLMDMMEPPNWPHNR